jgi:hypothetical protein
MKKLWLFIGLILIGPQVPLGAEPSSKQATFQVPYRLTDTQHVMVRAKINGKGPFHFIIDTGAPALFVATEAAKQIGVKPDKFGWGTLDRFEIEGGVVIPKLKARIETPFQLEGMNGMGLAGVHLDGIIGYTVLARYRLEFDFTRDKMAWTELGFKPPSPLGLMGPGGGAPGGLDALGGIMKVLGAFMGRKANPDVKLRGFLGIEVADVDGGVEVKAVLAQSPADKAGLKPGDRVQGIEGKKLSSCAKLYRLAAESVAGQTVRLDLIRDGEARTISVTLGEGL